MYVYRRGSGGVLKGLKAIKRRGVESLLEAVGASERTVDEEYSDNKKHFEKMVRELGELNVVSSQINTTFNQQPHHSAVASCVSSSLS